MAMKPETKYYVLLGKVLSAVKSSLTLRDSVVDVEGTADSEVLGVRLTINGKQFLTSFELSDAEKLTENEILDTLMSLYNVEL
jgi:hypothetical protein